MGKKRKRASVGADTGVSASEAPPARRWAKSHEPRVDPVFGQRSAIPGLDGSDDDLSDGGLSDDTSHDAITYLRSVRYEAQAIPALLCAPSAQDDHDRLRNDSDFHDERAFYVDGVYVAGPIRNKFTTSDLDLQDGLDVEGDADDDADDGAPVLSEPQNVYHESLLDRFIAHRTSLLADISNCSDRSPSLDHIIHPTSINRSVPSSHETAKWNRILLSSAPCRPQLAAMSQTTVLWLLDRIPSMIKRRRWISEGGIGGRMMGAWIWALLGRLGDLGTLSSEEVSIVRELGKRAGSILVGMEIGPDLEEDVDDTGNGHQTQGDESLGSNEQAQFRSGAAVRREENIESKSGDDDGIVEEEALQEDVDAVKARLLSTYTLSPTSQTGRNASSAYEESVRQSEEDNSAKEETLTAALDMILTVVGEFYGQRDLLIARDRLWERGLLVVT